MALRESTRFIDYPNRHVLGVIDGPTTVPAVVGALRELGARDEDVTVLRGGEGAARIDGTGASNGPIARLRRFIAFTLMDQLPDFILYERAIRDGRVVLAVAARADERKHAVRDVLRRHGGHFINYYGTFATEELDLWHGPELDMPAIYRR